MHNDAFSWLHRTGMVKNVSKGAEAASKPKVTTTTIAVKRDPENPSRTPEGPRDGWSAKGDVASTAKKGKSFVDEANTKGGTGDGWPSKPAGSPPSPRTKDGWSKTGSSAGNDHRMKGGMDDEVKYQGAFRAQETKSAKVDPMNTAKRKSADTANIEGNESAMYERLEKKTLKGLKGSTEKVLREGHNNKNWIAGAIKRPGAFTKKAKAAGKGVQEYAKEKASAPGRTGKQARLAMTLSKLRKGKK